MALTDLITISSSVLPDTTRVVAFRGVEAISRTYEFEIFLSLEGEEGDGLDLGDAIGAKAQLVIDRADDKLPPFVFAGILASVELLHAVEGRSLVRAVLVPRLWLLGLSKHSRIYTKKKLPEVIESILEDNGLSGDDYELRLGSYETEEHICQYRESDLDFISRWMEREGIFYYFIHNEDGEKLVISDGASYEDDIIGKPVRYFPQTGQDRSAGASFRAFTSRHRTLPSLVKLKDYDYARPNLTIAGSAQVASNGAGEVSLYGERFFSAAAGERLAKLRAEEMLAREVVYQARGTRSHLRAGHVFEIEEHPRAALNARYLAVEARHHGNQAASGSAFQQLLDLDHDEVYFVEVEAIPEGTQFRPEARTQWPRIYGYENGTVDGPADSEYAQIDDQGRYSVKFKFDETNLKDGKASTFVRMMQPHGGGVEGFHFPLRRNTEVVFSFLGGDPDRPVISGVVPNAHTPSPVTSGNHTKNIIQTGGRNRLELEDKSGQQRITMSTPHTNSYVRMGSPNDGHTMIIHTDAATLLDAGGDWNIEVGYHDGGPVGNKTEKVKGSVTETFEDVKTETVTKLVTENYNDRQVITVAKGQDLSITAGGQKIGIGGGMGVAVDGGVSFNVGAGTGLAAPGNSDFNVGVTGGNFKATTNQNIDMKATAGTQSYVSTGKATLKSSDGDVDIFAKGNINVTTEGKYTGSVSGDKTTNILGTSFKIVGSDKREITYGTGITFNANANANFTLAAEFNLKVGVFIDVKCSADFTFATGIKAEFSSVIDLRATPMKVSEATAGFAFMSAGVFMVQTPTLVFTGAAFMSRAAIQLIN
ncbi:type VI secretion system Vgr family protein [Polyangium fumosum]|uniref:type VI secretion system Vgr family protein n=1 Tax=Polyangium fumosum TaxID=889272 RepID=UPI001E3B05C4|nr:type VI secretion system tip protein TssI/VgrG [Polyangium fumosum]